MSEIYSILTQVAEKHRPYGLDCKCDRPINSDADWARHVAAEQERALREAGWVCVQLPKPTEVTQWGPVWETTDRTFGHIGTVQYRPDIRRIEIRDDYEYQYGPDELEPDALILLAVVQWARAAASVAEGETP